LAEGAISVQGSVPRTEPTSQSIRFRPNFFGLPELFLKKGFRTTAICVRHSI